MKKEQATVQVRIYPSTHKTLKVKAAKFGVTLAEYIRLIEKFPLKQI
jgi:predicted HicB family RNase H-like nuclease